ERELALPLVRDVARDAEDADDLRSVPDRRIRQRCESGRSIGTDEMALVAARLTEERRLELLLYHPRIGRGNERQRAPRQQIGAPSAEKLARRAVHRRKGALRIERVNGVRRRFEQVSVPRLRLRDRLARATLVFDRLPISLGGGLSVLV